MPARNSRPRPSRDTGPVVRPYALTGGRTQPADGEVLDLIAVVVARHEVEGDQVTLSPEHRKILHLCQHPATVVDVAADIGLPVGVVRVLLADLIATDWVSVLRRPDADEQPSQHLLKEILHGLRAL
ncbi:MAG TPA: DUF742 domain-containing protein [Streptosporangiaceae bacterium]|nr:DUF742 domain-containing protein [Streptosporangiaceae bacterium]